MNKKWWLIWLLPSLWGFGLQAEDLAPATLAKIMKLVVADAKESSIACTDPLLKFELIKVGVPVDPEARIVWVKTPQEKAKFRGSNRLTISGLVTDLDAGIIVAMVGEGGRCVFYISKANADANKVAVPSAIVKLGKVIR